MRQPIILAVAEPWGLYAAAMEADPSQLQRLAPTAHKARQLVRQAPPNHRPRIIPSLSELGRRMALAGLQSQPVAIYRPQPGPKGGRPKGQWLLFTFTPN